METNNATNNKSDKEKLKAVIQLLKPRERKHYNREQYGIMQEVVFEVSDNGELCYIISCLLRLCILCLDRESDFALTKAIALLQGINHSDCIRISRQYFARSPIRKL